MNNHCRCPLYLLFTIGTAFLMMGAGNQATSVMTGASASSPTGGSTGSVRTGMTGTVKSCPTGSVKSSVTGSIKSGATCSVVTRTTTTPTGSAATIVTRGTATLSPYAEELARVLKFDHQVLLLVKEETQGHIQRLVGFDEPGYQIIAPGIAAPVPEDRTDHVLAELRQKLVPLGYLPFVVEINAGIKTDRIGVLKGTDPYEILRIMHTDGDEYDISNQDVIDRLKEWEKISSFDIIGADSDWVELEFKTLPKDLKSFAEEVYDFSPDTVDQGPGNTEGLMKELRKTNRLFLWWD